MEQLRSPKITYELPNAKNHLATTYIGAVNHSIHTLALKNGFKTRNLFINPDVSEPIVSNDPMIRRARATF